MAEKFNPAEHNVEEVNEYLEGADDNERSRVLELEEAGPNRKTVRRDWSTDPDPDGGPDAEPAGDGEVKADEDPAPKKASKKASKPKSGFLDTGALVGIPPYSGPTRG